MRQTIITIIAALIAAVLLAALAVAWLGREPRGAEAIRR